MLVIAERVPQCEQEVHAVHLRTSYVNTYRIKNQTIIHAYQQSSYQQLQRKNYIFNATMTVLRSTYDAPYISYFRSVICVCVCVCVCVFVCLLILEFRAYQVFLHGDVYEGTRGCCEVL